MRKEKLEELHKYIEELKTIDIKEIDNNGKGFLSIKRYSCMLNNGKEITRERIVKNGKDGSAAIILPITKEGNVILVVQPRVFKPSTVGVEVTSSFCSVAALFSTDVETTSSFFSTKNIVSY